VEVEMLPLSAVSAVVFAPCLHSTLQMLLRLLLIAATMISNHQYLISGLAF
jgi:hypothetical protein